MDDAETTLAASAFQTLAGDSNWKGSAAGSKEVLRPVRSGERENGIHASIIRFFRNAVVIFQRNNTKQTRCLFVRVLKFLRRIAGQRLTASKESERQVRREM